MNLTNEQKEILADIRWQIEILMDEIYPDLDYLIPETEDLEEFIEGFHELYIGEFIDDDFDE